MADNKKGSIFGLGVLLGTVVGGLAAFFLSPTSGPENREMVEEKVRQLKKKLEQSEMPEMVEEIFKDAKEQGKKAYTMARKELMKKLEEVKNLDWEGYQDIVEEVVEKLKDETDISTDRAMKLRDFLVAEWNKAQKVTSTKAKKVTKRKAKK